MGRKKKQKRAPRGSGSVLPDKRRGGWMGKVPIGRYPDGRTRYREVRAPTQAEVVAKMRAVQPPGPDVTVGEWCDRWLSGLRIRTATLESYRVTVRKRIKPAFGSLRIDQLTPWHIESAAAEWATGPEPLDSGTLAKTLTHLSCCLQAAVRAQLIPRNPASLVRRPRARPVKFDLFSPEELRQIIDVAAQNRHWWAFALCAAMGLRIGEASALAPGDYDPATGGLTVNRTRTRAGANAPKSERSRRTIRAPAAVRPLLEAGVPGAPASTMAKRWERLLRKAGLRRRTPHQMRHAVASHALAAGVPLANLARDIGDTLEVVVKTYCHPTPGLDVCGAMEKLLAVTPEGAAARRVGGRR